MVLSRDMNPCSLIAIARRNSKSNRRAIRYRDDPVKGSDPLDSTAPLESTTMFMFVLIGNAVTMAILGKALWPEGGEGE